MGINRAYHLLLLCLVLLLPVSRSSTSTTVSATSFPTHFCNDYVMNPAYRQCCSSFCHTCSNMLLMFAAGVAIAVITIVLSSTDTIVMISVGSMVPRTVVVLLPWLLVHHCC